MREINWLALRAVIDERVRIVSANEQLSPGHLQRLDELQRRASTLLRNVVDQDILDQRGRVLSELDDILRTAAEDEQRALTESELARHGVLAQEFDVLTGEIDARRDTDTPRLGLTRSTDRNELQGRYDRAVGSISAAAAGRSDRGDRSRLATIGIRDRSATANRERRPGEILVLRSSESLVEANRGRWDVQPEDLSFDRLLRAWATGDWTGAEAESEVMRAQSIAPLPSGGFLVPEQMAASLIDLARKKARVLEAGAETVEMESATLHMGRIASDPTGAWLSENATASFTEGTYERLTFESKTLRAQVKASVELFEDASGLGGIIERQLAAALALELDRAALRGAGVDPEPRGILNSEDEGVTLQVLNATASYDAISTAVETIRTADGEPNAVLYAPRTAGVLDRLKDTTDQPLRPPPSVEGLRKLVTNQIPVNLGDGSNDSEAYVADFTQLMIGVRTQLTIEAFRAAADSTGSSVSDFQIWFRAYLRGDIQLAQPRHFVVITEIEP